MYQHAFGQMIIYVPFPSSPLHALTPTIVLVRSRQFYLLLHHDQVNIVHVEARCVLGLCFLLIFLFCPKIILLLFSFYLLGLLKSYLSSGAFKIIPVLSVFLSDSQASHLPNDVVS